MRPTWATRVRDRATAAVQWLGFTPTQRERWLNRKLIDVTVELGDAQIRLARVERLLQFREGLGAGTIETPAIRQALYGDRDR